MTVRAGAPFAPLQSYSTAERTYLYTVAGFDWLFFPFGLALRGFSLEVLARNSGG